MGVYPSAFHLAWTPPLQHDPRDESIRARRFIGALAVDVEPVVFWDGLRPDPAELLKRWMANVGFNSAFGTVQVRPNGPSGAGLARAILQPLGLPPDAVSFTDAVPWFFVKPGKGGQAEAMTERFAPIARAIGGTAGTLPTRPSLGSSLTW